MKWIPFGFTVFFFFVISAAFSFFIRESLVGWVVMRFRARCYAALTGVGVLIVGMLMIELLKITLSMR